MDKEPNKTAKEKLLSTVAAISKKIEAASEDELKAWADKLDATSPLKAEADKAQAEEKAIAEKSTGVPAAVAADDQNARSNANWPMDWPGRVQTASSLVKLACDILADDEEACAAGEEKKPMPPWLEKKINANTKVASQLVKLAKQLAADDEEDDDAGESEEDSSGKEVAAALVELAKTLAG